MVDRRCYVGADKPATIFNTDIPVTNTQGISVGDFAFWRAYSISNGNWLANSAYYPVEAVNHSAGTIKLTYTNTSGVGLGGGFNVLHNQQLNFATNKLAVKDASDSVSYTHLTLPTILLV